MNGLVEEIFSVFCSLDFVQLVLCTSHNKYNILYRFEPGLTSRKRVLNSIILFISVFLRHRWTQWIRKIQCYWFYAVCVRIPCKQNSIQENQCPYPQQPRPQRTDQLHCGRPLPKDPWHWGKLTCSRNKTKWIEFLFLFLNFPYFWGDTNCKPQYTVSCMYPVKIHFLVFLFLRSINMKKWINKVSFIEINWLL